MDIKKKRKILTLVLFVLQCGCYLPIQVEIFKRMATSAEDIFSRYLFIATISICLVIALGISRIIAMVVYRPRRKPYKKSIIHKLFESIYRKLTGNDMTSEYSEKLRKAIVRISVVFCLICWLFAILVGDLDIATLSNTCPVYTLWAMKFLIYIHVPAGMISFFLANILGLLGSFVSSNNVIFGLSILPWQIIIFYVLGNSLGNFICYNPHLNQEPANPQDEAAAKG